MIRYAFTSMALDLCMSIILADTNVYVGCLFFVFTFVFSPVEARDLALFS